VTAQEHLDGVIEAFEKTTYAQWLKAEGVATVDGFVVEDVRTVDVSPWPRLGCPAKMLNLFALMEGAKGMFVAEIPPGGSTEAQRHLYEQVILVLDGEGTTEIWQAGDAQKHVFEWHRGSVFSPPLNTTYRLFNVGRGPARFLAVNDAPAMHAADTSLSVEQAVDVAREAADFVLLERGLEVIRRGIEEGRKTFANTLKYVLITTSANLGNMVSMAAASLFLPFLPLTAGQILLNNFLSDVPAIGIADDSVDPELVDRPRRWNIRFIGRFMVAFGILSSAFDFLTFGALLAVFRATQDTFRTSWFVESLLTELVIALVMRTRRPFFKSRPGTLLLASTIGLVALSSAIPYLPVARVFGFVPLSGALLGAVLAITAL